MFNLIFVVFFFSISASQNMARNFLILNENIIYFFYLIENFILKSINKTGFYSTNYSENMV